VDLEREASARTVDPSSAAARRQPPTGLKWPTDRFYTVEAAAAYRPACTASLLLLAVAARITRTHHACCVRCASSGQLCIGTSSIGRLFGSDDDGDD